MNTQTPAHVAEHPMVVATSSGTIVVELAGPHAVILAEILARYDVLRSSLPRMEPIRQYSPAVWQHTMIRLLHQTALMRYPVAETVDVDIEQVDLDAPVPLYVVGGGA